LFKLGAAAGDAPVAELPTDPNLLAAFTGVAERRAIRFTYHDLDARCSPIAWSSTEAGGT
jgi:hypothetical protein